jgi:hypothetical protein
MHQSAFALTVSWGGSIEAIQPTGTLRDSREALLRMGLAVKMEYSSIIPTIIPILYYSWDNT